MDVDALDCDCETDCESDCENPDSDGVASLVGGRSRSMDSFVGDMTRESPGADESLSLGIGFPTRQQRVLISSITLSVSTSSGTRVERVAAGILTAAPKVVGGGRYVPKRRRRARMCEVSQEPAKGVVRREGNSGRAAKICAIHYIWL